MYPPPPASFLTATAIHDRVRSRRARRQNTIRSPQTARLDWAPKAYPRPPCRLCIFYHRTSDFPCTDRRSDVCAVVDMRMRIIFITLLTSRTSVPSTSVLHASKDRFFFSFIRKGGKRSFPLAQLIETLYCKVHANSCSVSFHISFPTALLHSPVPSLSFLFLCTNLKHATSGVRPTDDESSSKSKLAKGGFLE